MLLSYSTATRTYEDGAILSDGADMNATMSQEPNA